MTLYIPEDEQQYIFDFVGCDRHNFWHDKIFHRLPEAEDYCEYWGLDKSKIRCFGRSEEWLEETDPEERELMLDMDAWNWDEEVKYDEKYEFYKHLLYTCKYSTTKDKAIAIQHPIAKIIKEELIAPYTDGCPLCPRLRAEALDYEHYDKLSFNIWTNLNDTPFTRGEQNLDGWNSMKVMEHSCAGIDTIANFFGVVTQGSCSVGDDDNEPEWSMTLVRA